MTCFMDLGPKSDPTGEGWWTLWAPIVLTFSLLFRKGCLGRCLVSFWHPFGSTLAAFGSHLVPFGSLLAPFRSLFAPFGGSTWNFDSFCSRHFGFLSIRLGCFGSAT